jgi:hypothetical protein
LVELEPGQRFLERSRMLSMRIWEHERTLEPARDGCRVRDRLAFEPRLPGTGAALQRIVRAIFRHRHRHRRLRAHFS